MNEPFIADDQTMARVAELMKMFNDAVGEPNPAIAFATAKGVSSTAGLKSIEQLFQKPLLSVPAELSFRRPWMMLSAVVQRAAQNSDPILAVKIFGFMYFWGTVITPGMSSAAIFDVLLDKCEPAIEAEITTIAFKSLQQLFPSQVIFANDKASVTAEMLTHAAATVLVNAPEKSVLVDDVVMAAAKSLVK